jgi:hypothetical protein
MLTAVSRDAGGEQLEDVPRIASREWIPARSVWASSSTTANCGRRFLDGVPGSHLLQGDAADTSIRRWGICFDVADARQGVGPAVRLDET